MMSALVAMIAVQLRHDHDGLWPGKRATNVVTCSGLVTYSNDNFGRECRIDVCSTAGAPTCSSGFGSGASSGLASIRPRSSSSTSS